MNIFRIVAFVAAAMLTLPAVAATYEADNNGRFVVVAKVNGAPIRFKVDTGADDVVLPIVDAVRAGLTLAEIRSWEQAQVAGGGSIVTARVVLREIRLGRIAVRNFDAVLTREGNALLGMSFLSRLPGFHIAGRTLTIDDVPLAAIPPAASLPAAISPVANPPGATTPTLPNSGLQNGGEVRRAVPQDVETRVYWAGNWRQRAGLCSTRLMPDLQVQRPPQHGNVRLTADLGIPKSSGCPNQIYGSAVLYRPSPGFVGEDQFTFFYPVDPTTMNVYGLHGSITVNVVVR